MRDENETEYRVGRRQPRLGSGIRSRDRGAGSPAIPADAISLHAEADDEGFHLQETR